MDFSPPLVVASDGRLPVLLSVSHAGRDYPDKLLALSRGGLESLAPLEDPLVDRLVEPAVADGAGAVIARAPRAAADCNRAEDDLDPTTVAVHLARPLSARARGGLGVIPGRTASHGTLWRRPLSAAEYGERLDRVHRPFHQAIEEQLDRIAAAYGCALLIDCHSMPPLPGAPSVVVGDRHGASAAGWIRQQAVRTVAGAGFRPAVNDPFAGGHVIARHGRPRLGVHAIQVEIDRRLYLDDQRQLGPGWVAVAEMIRTLARSCGDALLDRSAPIAAE